MRVLLLAMALTVAATSLSGCCCPKADPAAVKKQDGTISKRYKTLKKIARKVPRTKGLEPSSCPDEQMEGLLEKGKTTLWGMNIEYEHLKTITSSKTKRVSEADEFAYLNDRTPMDLARHHRKQRTDTDRMSLAYFMSRSEYRYLAVFRANNSKTRREPELTDTPPREVLSKRRTAVAGKHFEPGVFKGWIIVFDMDTGDQVCQAPVEATNQKTLEYRHSGALAKRPKDAIRDDFHDNFRDAVKEALEGISEVFQVSI